ncbi:MAG: PIN domain-containing protein [Synergistaceae bacterium]|nr:PIN domain-containing protein [Synergistaceae bacterium]MBQ9580897.1 PIN domain-containing protein [Synergistaceae bacterium]MBR0043252.1 PIN domain-containing protein [Synergistaceae bacterium]
MKLLLDTNILLDVLTEREPFYDISAIIWHKCACKEFSGCISSLSFANMVYNMRKKLTPESIEILAVRMSDIFEFVDLNRLDIIQASKMRWKDFEDALQSVAAERIKADYIITRNIKDFDNSNVRALSPEDFLNLKL